jgi:hypothetical protein
VVVAAVLLLSSRPPGARIKARNMAHLRKRPRLPRVLLILVLGFGERYGKKIRIILRKQGCDNMFWDSVLDVE